MPKENASYKCLPLITYSVIRVNKKYYPQTLLEEGKYEIKKNKIENLIDDDLDSSSSDESDNELENEIGKESDNEPENDIGNESDNDESNDYFD